MVSLYLFLVIQLRVADLIYFLSRCSFREAIFPFLYDLTYFSFSLGASGRESSWLGPEGVAGVVAGPITISPLEKGVWRGRGGSYFSHIMQCLQPYNRQGLNQKPLSLQFNRLTITHLIGEILWWCGDIKVFFLLRCVSTLWAVSGMNNESHWIGLLGSLLFLYLGEKCPTKTECQIKGCKIRGC